MITLSNLIEKETKIVLQEIKDGVYDNTKRIPGKFCVISCSRGRWRWLMDSLSFQNLVREEGYGTSYQGFIWLRWGNAENRYASFLAYGNDGVKEYGNRLYDSSELFSIEIK